MNQIKKIMLGLGSVIMMMVLFVTGLKQGKTVVTCKVVYQKGQKKVIKNLIK